VYTHEIHVIWHSNTCHSLYIYIYKCEYKARECTRITHMSFIFYIHVIRRAFTYVFANGKRGSVLAFNTIHSSFEYVTLVEPHGLRGSMDDTYSTREFNTRIQHSYSTLIFNTHIQHSYSTLVFNTRIQHAYSTLVDSRA